MFVREFYSLDPVVDGSGRRRDVIPVRIFTTTTAVMDGRLRDVIPVAAVSAWQVGTDDVTPVMVVDADTVVDGSGRRRDVLPVRVVSGSLGFAPGAYFAADFTWGDQKYRKGVGAGIQTRNFLEIPGATSTGGAGFGTVQRNGVWQSVPANAPLIGDGGLGVWETRTNSIRNPVMAGAVPGVIGAGGAAPTNWDIGNGSGLAIEVLPLFQMGGLTVLPLRMSGVATGSGIFILLETNTGVAAAPGQIWTSQGHLALVVNSGPAPTIRLGQASRTGSGSIPPDSHSPDLAYTSTLQSFRFQGGAKPALTEFVRPHVRVGASPGVAQDFVVYIAAPNLKLGPDINDPPILQTSGLAATRTAMEYSQVLPAGDATDVITVEYTGGTATFARSTLANPLLLPYGVSSGGAWVNKQIQRIRLRAA